MDCASQQENIALYALGALGDEETRAFEAHLATCEACRTEVQAMRDTVGALAYAAPPVPLPGGLKGRVMDRIQAPAAAAEPLTSRVAAFPPPRSSRMWQVASLALGAGLLLSIAGLMGQQTQLSAERARTASLERRLSEAQDRLAVLRARDVQMASLTGQAPKSEAVARIFWSPERKAWLMTDVGLPAASEGRVYQLWAVTPDAKVSMGTFQTDHEGGAIIETTLELPTKPVAAAVSVEPAGGVPQPTGQIVLLGNI
jgi:anti-sigma-K factor RskA